MRPQLAGIPGFGLLYSVILVLIAIPAALIYARAWGVWPWTHSVGLEVRIMKPATLTADFQVEPVIASVITQNRPLMIT
jgi:hypothetical protein